MTIPSSLPFWFQTALLVCILLQLFVLVLRTRRQETLTQLPAAELAALLISDKIEHDIKAILDEDDYKKRRELLQQLVVVGYTTGYARGSRFYAQTVELVERITARYDDKSPTA